MSIFDLSDSFKSLKLSSFIKEETNCEAEITFDCSLYLFIKL